MVVGLLLVTDFVYPQSVSQEAVGKFITASGFENASIGVYAIDVESKQVIMDYGSTRLLTPASTTKLFSTAFAFDKLGGDYRPATSLFYNGTVSDSILSGDIWIIGGGDMSLGSKFFDAENKTAFLNEWGSALLSSGIREVNGTVFVDGSDYGYEGVPDDWLWGDIGNYYGAHFSGAMVYDNLIEYHFKTTAAGKPAELMYTIPRVDSLRFTSNIVSAAKPGDNSYIFGAPYSFVREGRGTLPQNTADFMVKGSLPDPETQLAVDFSKKMKELGITHRGQAISTREIRLKRPAEAWVKILDYKGRSVREIAAVTNYESINVFAEGLMRLTSFVNYGNGTHENASSNMLSYWKEKLNATALYLNDGSGLARTNAVTAKTMCDLLVYMNASGSQVEFYETLPVAGVSGTLKGVARNQTAHGKVHAKSGTMRRTKSYAGYAETNSGKRIAFAFIVNNYTCSNKQIVQQMELLMNALVKE